MKSRLNTWGIALLLGLGLTTLTPSDANAFTAVCVPSFDLMDDSTFLFYLGYDNPSNSQGKHWYDCRVLGKKGATFTLTPHYRAEVGVFIRNSDLHALVISCPFIRKKKVMKRIGGEKFSGVRIEAGLVLTGSAMPAVSSKGQPCVIIGAGALEGGARAGFVQYGVSEDINSYDEPEILD
jgi:hypothetical protein